MEHGQEGSRRLTWESFQNSILTARGSMAFSSNLIPRRMLFRGCLSIPQRGWIRSGAELAKFTASDRMSAENIL
jgi:hypothetical protein